MVATEDSFSEIAKVIQDCENGTQESMKGMEKEKDEYAEVEKRAKVQCERLVKSARCRQFVASGEDVVERQRGETSGIPEKCCSSGKEILERPKEPNISQRSGSFVLSLGRTPRRTSTLMTGLSYHSYIKRK